MSRPQSFGARLRLDRIDRNGDGRLMIVPLDHSVADGPVTPDDSLDDLVAELAAARVDAVVLHKGTVRHLNPKNFVSTSLIVHLSASTSHAPDPDAKYLVTSVEAALRLGADAVSVHVNMGSQQEAAQIADLSRTAEETERWGIPLMAMMYARGPEIEDSNDPELVLHSATLAADLGADVVKVSYPGSASAMADVVAACPIPVVVAGGPPVDDKKVLMERVASTVRAGAAGLAMGRNIFQHPNPGRLAREIGDVVHGRMAIAA
ncbi:2-amino-3,7-dideoxy-D-threo-hept-6-ulosonate synthase [Saccharothrix longispora]|uniref:2-amino-4, 5-dihydroxy-6-oxo-7-(Phosphonooxy)heptanoate synthase n=1 Tax=Saccharothrix longispora TaxID=33920 RepID=A0ABU1PQR5_9PSEU|nr:2-amino-3,7-dideoxy-D-threo-hept-6-ulosonate synthase [Saccharothrix longispora]MDR6592992.1 2-amino-4,5-dihydroxy-6-oxo-7-(phosphonooxy)heptanoate synthase [Saccharothrix longispora]